MNYATRKSFLIVSIAIITIASSFFVFTHPHSDNLTSCESKYNLYHGDLAFEGAFDFVFLKNKGDLTVNGKVKRNGKTYIVNRQISFNYKMEGDIFLLQSTKVYYFSQDIPEKNGINKHLPDFFNQKGGGLALERKFGPYGNSIFFLAGTPLFFCQKE